MVANPAFELVDEEATDILLESLRILDRCDALDRDADEYDICPGRLPLALRERLLTAAQIELCVVRQQLTFWRVMWAMFRHREERAIRRPYWRLKERQRFHDGARVAELLVAIRQRLVEIEDGREVVPKVSFSHRKSDSHSGRHRGRQQRNQGAAHQLSA